MSRAPCWCPQRFASDNPRTVSHPGSVADWLQHWRPGAPAPVGAFRASRLMSYAIYHRAGLLTEHDAPSHATRRKQRCCCFFVRLRPAAQWEEKTQPYFIVVDNGIRGFFLFFSCGKVLIFSTTHFTNIMRCQGKQMKCWAEVFKLATHFLLLWCR